MVKLFDDDKIYSVRQVAEILNCGKDTVYRRIHQYPNLSQPVAGLRKARLLGSELNKVFEVLQ